MSEAQTVVSTNQDTDDKNKDNNLSGNIIKGLEPSIQAVIIKAIEDARSSEKDKLYSRIQKLEEENSTLKNSSKDSDIVKKENLDLSSKLTTLGEQIADLQTKINAQEDTKKKTKEEEQVTKEEDTKGGGEVKMKDKVIEDLVATVGALTEKIEKSEHSFEERLQKAMSSVEQKQTQKEIDAYRENAIQGLPANIAKLVPSTSVEDINTSITAIQTDLLGIVAQNMPKGSGSLLGGNRVPFTPNPSLGGISTPTVDQIQNMNQEQYTKFREENAQLFNGGQRSGFSGGTLRSQ